MLILIGTSVNLILGEGSIIKHAGLGKEKYQISASEERLNLFLNDVKIDSISGKENITIESLKTKLEREDWIGNVKEESDSKLQVTTTDGYLFLVTWSNENYIVESQGKDDGEPYPTISLEQLPTSGVPGEVIKIKVTATVNRGGNTKGIQTVENMTTGESKQYEEGGVIFEVSQNGEYIFKATTNAGKSKTSKILVNVSTGGPINISIVPTTPRNTIKEGSQNQIATGPIDVNIRWGETNIERNDKFQYRIGTQGEWQTSEDTTANLQVTENTIVTARYYNGDESIGLQTYNIQNVDNIEPVDFTPTATSTTNTIEVTASTTDTASSGAAEGIAGILRYEYSMDGSIWQEENVLTGLAQNTEYNIQVKAIDKAGNEKIGTVNIRTKTVPGGENISFKASTTSWTNQNIIVEIQFPNVAGYAKQYSLDNRTWNTYTNAIEMSSNGTIYARLIDSAGQPGETTQYEVNKIDKQEPNAPSMSVSSGVAGNEGWYRGNVVVSIINGTDTLSGAANSTYTVSGAQNIGETRGNSVTITAEGTSTITAYTYDNAGNKSKAATITIKKDSVGPTFSGVQDKSIYDTNVNNITSGVSISDTISGVTSSTAFTYNPQTLTRGENIITYTATDKAGNTTSIQRKINVMYAVCFVEGTKVSTLNGLINIEDLKVGDIVYTYNEQNGKIEEKPIQKTFINPSMETATITFENGETIENTKAHPYYVVGKGWTETKDLKLGYKILTQSGKVEKIVNIETNVKPKEILVYNLHIQDNHNYFVGNTKLLVHNAFSVASGAGICGLEEYPIE